MKLLRPTVNGESFSLHSHLELSVAQINRGVEPVVADSSFTSGVCFTFHPRCRAALSWDDRGQRELDAGAPHPAVDGENEAQSHHGQHWRHQHEGKEGPQGRAREIHHEVDECRRAQRNDQDLDGA